MSTLSIKPVYRLAGAYTSSNQAPPTRLGDDGDDDGTTPPKKESIPKKASKFELAEDMSPRETLIDFAMLAAGFFIGWKGFRYLKQKSGINLNNMSGVSDLVLKHPWGKKAEATYSQLLTPEGREAARQNGVYLPDNMPPFDEAVSGFFEKFVFGAVGATAVGGGTFFTLNHLLPGKPSPAIVSDDPKAKAKKAEAKTVELIEKAEQLALIWGFMELGQELLGKGIFGQIGGFIGGYIMSNLLIRLQHFVSNKINQALLPEDYNPDKPSLIGMFANAFSLAMIGTLVYLLKAVPIKLVKGVASLNSPSLRNIMNAGVNPTVDYLHTVPIMLLKNRPEGLTDASQRPQFDPKHTFIQNLGLSHEYAQQSLEEITASTSIPEAQKGWRKLMVRLIDTMNHWGIGSPHLAKVMDKAATDQNEGGRIKLPWQETTVAILRDYPLKIAAAIPSVGLLTFITTFIGQLIASPFSWLKTAFFPNQESPPTPAS